MIPKIIHYCWFGRNPKPKLAQKCIRSWRKFCSDYEIREWNEDNFCIANAPLYVRQAYECRKYAFVSDYVRLKVVEVYGGVYFDTDVELRKPINDLLAYHSFFASETQDGSTINTGLGFGAEKGHPLVRKMREEYENISFQTADGKMDLLPCPIRNTRSLQNVLPGKVITEVLNMDDNLFLPRDFFNPMDYLSRKLLFWSANTRAIHWGASSWMTKEQLALTKRDRRYRLIYLFCEKLVGKKGLQALKTFFRF